MPSFNASEIATLQKYLQSKFKNPGLTVKTRERAADSLEVILNGEFLGTIYKDQEDGETSYDFNMAILDIDLQDAA
ncbi:MAG: DUF3126 family protein [Alphaproteobacteria bacterium]